MKQDRISIVYKRVGDLVPDESNPRRNDMAVDAVANSIRQFGMRTPVILDNNNNIVAGHTRYKALMRLYGEDYEVPCVLADKLTPKQLKAFELADNKTG